MDQHVPEAITEGLRDRGIDVLTAYDDGHGDAEDQALLLRATKLGRILFTRDRDLLAIGREAQDTGAAFSGIIYAHQLRVSIGQAVRDIELICQALSEEEMRNEIYYLPL
jgi:hypothetical protein